MNLGIYISNINNEYIKELGETINSNIGSKLTDASIFYDNVGFNPINIKCGMFNSTDLWNFNGKLLTLSLDTTIKAIKIVNDIDLYYYYGLEDKISPLSLIYLLGNNIEIIAQSEESASDLYRKTRRRPVFIAKDFEEFITKV